MEMRLAALCSGGKDSLYALWLALKEGHEAKKIVVMMPERKDSWMFHKPNLQLTKILSEATGLPTIKGETSGVKKQELEDLESLLERLSIDGVISGAIDSNYQKEKIEKVCNKLEIDSIFPLWHKDSFNLLRKMIKEDFEIIITSVSAGGLGKEWLGEKIDKESIEGLERIKDEFGIHLAGEGGEYETLVLDSPLFKKRIVPIETEKVWMGDRGHLTIKKTKLNQKSQ